MGSLASILIVNVDYTLQIFVVYSPSSCLVAKGIMAAMSPVDETNEDQRNVVCKLLGESVKKIRISAGMSQEALAFAAEIDRTYVSGIERGAANPSLLTLANICHALGITLSDLFQNVSVALPPGGRASRRANAARPKVKVAKSRLR